MDRAELLRLSATALRERAGGRLTVLPDADAVHRQFAEEIAGEIAANNRADRPTRLILPVGPTKQYPLLVELCNRDEITWRGVHAFFMDEYCDWQARPLPPSHPLSFEGTARSLCAAVFVLEELPGDYNASGTVEQGDLDLVLLHWGADAPDAPASWINDLPTGTIDQDELDGVLLNWGEIGAAPAVSAGVPEPRSVLVLLFALAAAITRSGVVRGTKTFSDT